ncbi:MAG: hypothetical protein ABL953_09450 [Ilumatobacteraceae bacterium]
MAPTPLTVPTWSTSSSTLVRDLRGVISIAAVSLGRVFETAVSHGLVPPPGPFYLNAFFHQYFGRWVLEFRDNVAKGELDWETSSDLLIDALRRLSIQGTPSHMAMALEESVRTHLGVALVTSAGILGESQPDAASRLSPMPDVNEKVMRDRTSFDWWVKGDPIRSMLADAIRCTLSACSMEDVAALHVPMASTNAAGCYWFAKEAILRYPEWALNTPGEVDAILGQAARKESGRIRGTRNVANRTDEDRIAEKARREVRQSWLADIARQAPI